MYIGPDVFLKITSHCRCIARSTNVSLNTMSLLFFLLFHLLGFVSGSYYEPQQIHISSGSSREMTIMWNTPNDTIDSRVIFGKDKHSLNLVVIGTSSKFSDGGPGGRVQFIHTAILTDLDHNTKYYYKVGSKSYGIFSGVLSLTTWPAGEAWSPRLAVFGDMGKDNARSLPRLTADAVRGMYHAMLHVGDIAYNLDSDDGQVGDAFMCQIEPIASAIPYMTCPGNHEGAYNFSSYKNRFRMPGDVNQRMFYSFKMGPIRFISTNTEVFYSTEKGLSPAIAEYNWLKDELADANLPENRAKQPWVLTFGHRPMYCSNPFDDYCNNGENVVRTGIPDLHIPGWEMLFYNNGVDVSFWAHQHSYERLWPVYNRKVMNGSYDKPYTNPKGPIHIITGSAGCVQDHSPFGKTAPNWSAFRSDDYGYSRLTVFNSTHLVIEQVSDDKGGEVIDKILVIKDKHGPY